MNRFLLTAEIIAHYRVLHEHLTKGAFLAIKHPAGLSRGNMNMTRHDPLTPEERSERMARIRNADTKPEMIVRRLVHGMGYRYRLHARDLPGHPDLVFRPRKKVIFVHGCFWHQHGCRQLERHHTGAVERDLEYRVVYRLLDAAEYGVPQHRHRVFIVGFRADLQKQWSFPASTHSLDRLLWDQWITGDYWDEHRVAQKDRPPASARHAPRIFHLKRHFGLFPPPGERCRTVRDALAGLSDPRNKTVTVPNHEFRDGARPYPGHTGSTLDAPSKALKAGDHGVPGGENMIALPDGTYRYYTVRESARVQTFPDDYLFSGSWTEAMRQIGNAVPVQLAAVVGRSILKQID